MASDFAVAEVQGEFGEVTGRMGPGLTFVIQAQPYLTAVPMPLGLEAVCLKACTHYPTLFDHFQRELRGVLQELQRKGVVENWQEAESWKLLKELANSGMLCGFFRNVSDVLSWIASMYVRFCVWTMVRTLVLCLKSNNLHCKCHFL